MRYTRTALGLLNAQYRSVLKKCFMINMGLFALGASVGTANAAITLAPTLDTIKTAAEQDGAVSSEAYELTKLASGATLPEGAAAVKIGSDVYYFSPKDNQDAKLLSILAGTPVATVNDISNPTSITFDVANISSKFPSSVFGYAEGTENDYNFVVQEADESGNISKKYYKVVINSDRLGTSQNISWTKLDAKPTDMTDVVAVKLPNNKTEYYKYTYNQPADRKVYDTRQTSLSGNVNADFVGAKLISSYNANGGAIYNYMTINSITGDFIGNYDSSLSSSSYARGGAIYNSGTINSITGDFIGNYASYSDANGGAIYNFYGTINSITGDFIGNYASSTSSRVQGGAIYNSGTINSITGDFIGNYASSTNSVSDANGGAIYNYNIINSITGDFVGNYASSSGRYVYGGAIYNYNIINSITGDFVGNYASSSGRHVYGGAIFNGGTINSITGDFVGNYASSSSSSSYAYGGAIYNNGTISSVTGDFIDNYASSTSSRVQGGAIYNSGTIKSITGDFIGNYASSSSSSSSVYGGAIYNYSGYNYRGTINSITGDFIGNYASSSSSAEGGAIDNRGTINSITGNFIGNYASSSSSAEGGAIYNRDTINNITGDFIGNYASSSSSSAKGGAIYNRGTITFGGASEFTDNYVEKNGQKESNAIHNERTINFNSGKIVLNDAVSGNNGTLNLSGQTTATADNDVISINNTVAGNIVNLKQGTLKLGHYDSTLFNTKFVGTFADDVAFNVSGGKLTTQDDEIHEHSLGNLTLNTNLNTAIDVDLNAKTGDVLTGSTTATSANDSKILIDNIKILNDGTNHIIKVKVADENIKDSMDLANNVTVDRASNDTNNYLIVYEKDATSGNLKFGQVDALETAVQFENANKAFSMGSDITTDTDLGALTGDSLSISGAGHTMDGSGFGGMNIAQNQTVSLNDVTIKGFAGAFAENNGTMNISASEGNEVNLNSAISNNGKLNLTGAGETNINSAISGNGTINANNDGALNINSAVNAGLFNTEGKGKFNFNDTLTADTMNVSGGELNLKNGTELANVENFVANGGVLNVGDQTINLKNATFNDGSTVAINVKSDGNGLLKADSLTINGGNLKATLGQGIVDMQNKQKTVTLLESGTAFDNNFADVMENNMYRFEKAEKAGDYIISLTKTAEDVSQENGGTSNNANEAKAWVDGSKFEQGTVSTDVADKLADLAQNDAQGFNNALTALAPSDASMVRTNSVNNNTEMFKTVVSHLEDVSKKHKFGLASGDELNGVSVWAKAFGNHAKLDDTAKAYGFKSDGYGATLGIEKQLNESFRAGVGYSYVYNDVSGFMRDSDVNTHTGFVYGEYRPNAWYVNAIASYGYSDYDETKHVAGSKYKAKYDVDNIGAQVMTGYNANVAKVDFTPEAGLRYNNIHRDNYVDGAGQSVKAETMDVLTAVAGVKVGKDLVSCFGAKGFYWRPEARLAATYDLISDKENAVVSLSNGSGYVVDGQRLKRFGIEAGAGVTFFLTPDVESSVGYEGKFRKDYQDHTGYISAKYKF